jgi:hypothetical protein
MGVIRRLILLSFLNFQLPLGLKIFIFPFRGISQKGCHLERKWGIHIANILQFLWESLSNFLEIVG